MWVVAYLNPKLLNCCEQNEARETVSLAKVPADFAAVWKLEWEHISILGKSGRSQKKILELFGKNELWNGEIKT